MVPALGKPQATESIPVEGVRSHGSSRRVREPSPREKDLLSTGVIPGTGRGAGHTAVNNQVPAHEGEPHCSWGEGQ